MLGTFLGELLFRHSDQGGAVHSGALVTDDVERNHSTANPIPAVLAKVEAGGRRVSKGRWGGIGSDPLVKGEFHP